jgi:hypothetical protein
MSFSGKCLEGLRENLKTMVTMVNHGEDLE